MRYISALLVVVSLAVPSHARSAHAWRAVKRLSPDAPIVVLLWSAEQISGRIQTADDSGLRLIPFEWSNGGRSVRAVERADIQRISTIHQHHLPDPGRWMIVGTIAGGAIGATAGAVSDASHHTSNARWFTGGLGGAGLGFFASCAALAGVGVFDMGSDILHPRRVVYEDVRNNQPHPQ
jgi:hypothetical protein